MSRLTRRGALLGAAAAAMVPLAAQAADVAPEGPLRALYTALEAAMRTGDAVSFLHRFDDLAPVVDRAFDLETVLKGSVGGRWDTMEPAGRLRLYQVYRRFTIATYVANFSRYDGERFQILPGTRDLGGDRVVGTEIINRAEHLRVDYVMRGGNGRWRAVDVLFDGAISQVGVQRADFRKVLATGDTEALIVRLHRKIADLSDGALNS